MVASIQKITLGKIDGSGMCRAAEYLTGFSRTSKNVDDYYTHDQRENGGELEPAGIWMTGHDLTGGWGAGKAPFGIEAGKAITPGLEIERFNMLLRGRDPDSGASIVQNADAENRTSMLDLTLSAPKSFSVAWGMCPSLRDKLEEVELNASKAALAFMQNNAAITRVVKVKGQPAVREKCNLVIASFQHGSSRAGDMQLHRHNAIMNICQRKDGSTGAIETQPILKYLGATASMYHAGLAWGARRMGLGIEVADGKKIFELQGIPQDVMDEFSQRSQEVAKRVRDYIEDAADRSLATVSKDDLKRYRGMVQQAVLETRQDKLELSRAELEAQWIERGAALGFTEEQALVLMAQEHDLLPLEQLEAMGREAIEELMDKESVFNHPDLVVAVATKLQGYASPTDILAVVETMKADLIEAHTDDRRTAYQQTFEAVEAGEASVGHDPEAIGETVYTTRARLATEWRMVQDARSVNTAHQIESEAIERQINVRGEQIAASIYLKTFDGALVSGLSQAEAERKARAASEGAGLSDEQKAAMRHVLSSDRTVSVIQGRAGSGKTFMTKAITDLYASRGYETIALAASHEASKNLAKDCGLNTSRAITGFLNDIQQGRLALSEKSVIVLDEAGQTGTVQMARVVEEARKSGAKVILLGDTLQQGSVTAGSALKMLVNDREIGSASLTEIRRQVDAREREAVTQIFNQQSGEAGVLTSGGFAGKAHVIDGGSEVIHERMISDWQAWRAANAHRPADQRTTLFMAHSRADVQDLNMRAHDVRQAAGELGKEFEMEAMGDKAPTIMKFSVGEEITLRNNERIPKQGTKAYDAWLQEGSDRATNRTRGIIQAFEPEAPTFKKGATTAERDESIEAARGHGTLVFQVVNNDGTLGKVMRLSTRDAEWQAKTDGKKQKNLGLAVQHSYAQTNASAQGLTVTAAFAKDSTGYDSKAAGVTMSRHREHVSVYIDKVARYDAYTRFEEVNAIKTYDQFSDAECLARVEQAWSKSDDKANARDYHDWQAAGTAQARAQGQAVELETLTPEMEALTAKPEAPSAKAVRENEKELERETLQGSEVISADRGNALGQDSKDGKAKAPKSNASQEQGERVPTWHEGAAQRASERIAQEAIAKAQAQAKADERRAAMQASRSAHLASNVYAFERKAEFALPEVKAQPITEAERAQLTDDLARRGVSWTTIEAAERQGYMQFVRDEQGRPTVAYQGYSDQIKGSEGQRQCVNRLTERAADAHELQAGQRLPAQRQEQAEAGTMRDRYAPVLKGDGRSVVVAESGFDGLRAWSLAEREGKPMPTVIVVPPRQGQAQSGQSVHADRSLNTPQVREALAQAERVDVMSPNKDRGYGIATSVQQAVSYQAHLDAKAQAQQEAQRQEQAQAQDKAQEQGQGQQGRASYVSPYSTEKHSIQRPTSQPDIDVRESTANDLAAQREAEAERERRRREEEQQKAPGYLR